MIKLQDFARQLGISDRMVQKHMNTYAAELEGHFERRGHNGTWLDETAQEIIRSKVKQQPVVFFDEDPRLAKLEAENTELQRQLNAVNEDFRKYAANTSAMLSKAAEQLQLAERATEYKKQVENLESELEREKDVAITLSQKVDEVESVLEETKKRADEAESVVSAALEEADKEKAAKEEAKRETEREKAAKEKAIAEAEMLRARLEKMKKRNLWERIVNIFDNGEGE